jgi:endonuclease III
MQLAEALDRLEARYGKQLAPPTTDPFELILWENVAYLADDPTRLSAFHMLQNRVGTRPDDILAAHPESLLQVARAGIIPEQTVEKLRAAAQLARDEADGDLGLVHSLPLARARRLLRRFPGLGEPGADKILLFSRTQPVFALDSNGLRTLLRRGYGREAKNYAATYRSVIAAIEGELPRGVEGLIRAYLLLRRHGQELCRRTSPVCEACPLAPDCAYWLNPGGRATITS